MLAFSITPPSIASSVDLAGIRHLGGWPWFHIRKLFPNQPIRLVLDDTLVAKKGPQVFGLGVHVDPVRSTRSYKAFCFGHVWVVLAVLVTFPCSLSAWALPLLRNINQLLEFADASARSRLAVQRTAPMVGLLYTILVLWFAQHAVGTSFATLPIRPWYRHKRGLCFADVLRAAHRARRQVDVVDLRWRNPSLDLPSMESL